MSIKVSGKDYYVNPRSQSDFVQIAIDYFGNSIRDNSFQELAIIGMKVHMGEIE
tara:strand:+ start:4623 stop:4784 length:162 start_codon:yes stop_codon:yes gene_type:complete